MTWAQGYPILDEDFPLTGFLQYCHEPLGTGLELGANENYSCAILQAMGHRMTGIDVRPFEPDFRLPAIEIQHSWTQIQATVQEALVDPPYDFIVSLSAIEHFGLGAYPGDVTDPEADGAAMRRAWQWVKSGGSCWLTVPVGIPKITDHWRRYSKAELYTRLFSGFQVEAVWVLHAWDVPLVSFAEACQWDGVGCNYEPLFWLRKKG